MLTAEELRAQVNIFASKMYESVCTILQRAIVADSMDTMETLLCDYGADPQRL